MIGALGVAAGFGALVAIAVLPNWAPAMARSLQGSDPPAFWYLSRASGLVAYTLLWLSMMAGLSTTNRWARVWPGGPLVFDLHQHTALLGIAFSLFHALVLLGDRHLDASWVALAVPFTVPGTAAAWIGLGQVAWWGLLVVGLSFYARKQLGPRTWRLIHFASFTVFTLALVHGVMAGSDTADLWVRWAYATTGGAVLLASARRISTSPAKR